MLGEGRPQADAVTGETGKQMIMSRVSKIVSVKGDGLRRFGALLQRSPRLLEARKSLDVVQNRMKQP